MHKHLFFQCHRIGYEVNSEVVMNISIVKIFDKCLDCHTIYSGILRNAKHFQGFIWKFQCCINNAALKQKLHKIYWYECICVHKSVNKFYKCNMHDINLMEFFTLTRVTKHATCAAWHVVFAQQALTRSESIRKANEKKKKHSL